MKCKHPNFQQFIKENGTGLEKIKTIASDAIKLYNSLASDEISQTIDNVMSSDEARNLLAECTINTMESFKKRVAPAYVNRIKPCEKCGELAKINIYGSLKIGDRGKYEIYDDIKNHMIYDDIAKRPIFNMYNCVQIGVKLKELKRSSSTLEWLNGICLDVNATLVRYFNSEEYYKNEAEVNMSLLSTIFNRIILFQLLYNDFRRVLIDNIEPLYGEFKMNNITQTIDIRFVLKVLMIYKLWYNIVNGLDESNFECSVSELLDLVDNNMARTFNATQAIHDGFITMYNRLVITKGDEMRHPDKYLFKLMNQYNKAVSTYFTTNVHRGQGAYYKSNNYTITVGVESVSAENLIRSLGYEEGGNNYVGKEKGLFGFLGTESMQANTKQFDEFRRKTRAEIISKLEPNERRIFMQLESDVIRLRSQAMAVNTVVGQQTALKRCEAVAKLIMMEMNRSKNDTFIVLLSTLDSERLTVQTELANRDILKERNTRLYGQEITRNEWNY